MKSCRLIHYGLITFFCSVLVLAACPVTAASINEPITVGDITYVSGGIGESEAAAIRELAKEYPLEIVFVQKLAQREELLAAVKLQLQDQQLKILLDVVTDGPYLLARLPPGQYLLLAEYNNVVKQQWVNLASSRHQDAHHKTSHNQKIVFWWPIAESQQ